MQTRPARWLLLPALLLAAPVLAQESAPDPARLKVAADDFDEGSRLFKLKQFEQAADRFESADRLAPSPASLANAIRARKAAKQNARAATLAAQVANRYPDDKALKELADSVIKGVDRTLGRVDVACSPACTLLVDGKIAASDAVGQMALFLEPGAHTLVAGWSGDRSKTSKVEAKKGAAESVSFEAPPEPKPQASSTAAPPPPSSASASSAPPLPPPPPEVSSGLPPWVFWAGVGATVLVGGVTVWSGLDTQANPGPDKVRDECAGKSRDCPAFQDGLSKERRTNILIGTTAGLGVATAVVGALFTDWKGGGAAPSTGGRVSPTMNVGQGVSLGLIGVF